jgi:hypothetical protein
MAKWDNKILPLKTSIKSQLRLNSSLSKDESCEIVQAKNVMSDCCELLVRLCFAVKLQKLKDKTFDDKDERLYLAGQIMTHFFKEHCCHKNPNDEAKRITSCDFTYRVSLFLLRLLNRQNESDFYRLIGNNDKSIIHEIAKSIQENSNNTPSCIALCILHDTNDDLKSSLLNLLVFGNIWRKKKSHASLQFFLGFDVKTDVKTMPITNSIGYDLNNPFGGFDTCISDDFTRIDVFTPRRTVGLKPSRNIGDQDEKYVSILYFYFILVKQCYSSVRRHLPVVTHRKYKVHSLSLKRQERRHLRVFQLLLLPRAVYIRIFVAN